MKPLNDPDASDFTTMKKPDLIKKLLSYGPQEVSFFFFWGSWAWGLVEQLPKEDMLCKGSLPESRN